MSSDNWGRMLSRWHREIIIWVERFFVSSMLQSSVQLLEGTSSEVVHGGGELVNQDAGDFFLGGG